MGKLFYKILDIFSSNFVRQLATSLGVGLAVGLPFYLFITNLVDEVAASFQSIEYIGLLAKFGIDDALGIIFTAVLTRVYWESMKPKWVARK